MCLEACEPPRLPRRHLCAEAHKLDLARRLHGIVETNVLELGLLRLEDLLLARRAQPALPGLTPQARMHAAAAADDSFRGARDNLGGTLQGEQRVVACVRRGACHCAEHGLVACLLLPYISMPPPAIYIHASSCETVGRHGSPWVGIGPRWAIRVECVWALWTGV